jgi:hypothetical protein
MRRLNPRGAGSQLLKCVGGGSERSRDERLLSGRSTSAISAFVGGFEHADVLKFARFTEECAWLGRNFSKGSEESGLALDFAMRWWS